MLTCRRSVSAHTGAIAVGRGRALSRCSTAAPTASACAIEVGGANIVRHRGGAGLPPGQGSAVGLVSRSCRDTLQRQSVDFGGGTLARWLGHLFATRPRRHSSATPTPGLELLPIAPRHAPVVAPGQAPGEAPAVKAPCPMSMLAPRAAPLATPRQPSNCSEVRRIFKSPAKPSAKITRGSYWNICKVSHPRWPPSASERA